MLLMSVVAIVATVLLVRALRRGSVAEREAAERTRVEAEVLKRDALESARKLGDEELVDEWTRRFGEP